MSEYVYAGLTSQSIDLFIRDSSSTTGQGLTGLAYNSGSLVASYRKGATGTRTAITLATQTVGGAFSSGGFVEIDATNMPGCYRLDLPNAAVDTAGFVTVFLKGAANMVPVALRIDCRPIPADIKQIGADAQSATDLKDFADAGYDPSTNKVNAVLDSATQTQIDEIQDAVDALGAASSGVVERSVSDTNAITFAWPVSGATITGTRSLNNGSYAAVDGAIAFLRTETGKHYYTLAFDADDRPSVEGQVRYKFVDGTYTRYVVLRVEPDLTPAQVNAQVLDVLSVDTFSELTAPPAATSSLKDKITWLFMYARNKVTQTAIARTLYRDDTTTVAGTSTTSDNGTTFTKGEDA
jgi:hypothetical protein